MDNGKPIPPGLYFNWAVAFAPLLAPLSALMVGIPEFGVTVAAAAGMLAILGIVRWINRQYPPTQ